MVSIDILKALTYEKSGLLCLVVGVIIRGWEEKKKKPESYARGY
jgi:hypothetical protein